MPGKRGNGEGSITRRKDGLYMACYTVQTQAGPKRKTVYGKTAPKPPISSIRLSQIGAAVWSSIRERLLLESTQRPGSLTACGEP
jgi:hypothetical protein